VRSRRPGPIGWLFVVAIVLAAGAFVVNRTSHDTPRVALWGDSLAWESKDAFTREARSDGETAVLVRTWGGTAPCDWLPDIRDQARRWRPTTAVLVFSGNQVTDCMKNRELVAAYRQDVTKAVELLTDRGIEVVLVEAPPRRDQQVDAAGQTALDRLWREIAAAHERTRVAPAGRVLTDNGRYTATLPCASNETCDPGGLVTVRGPDGVHFCPVAQSPMTRCPVPAPGAVRFGTEIARETLRSSRN
jgi:hypothetical protein